MTFADYWAWSGQFPALGSPSLHTHQQKQQSKTKHKATFKTWDNRERSARFPESSCHDEVLRGARLEDAVRAVMLASEFQGAETILSGEGVTEKSGAPFSRAHSINPSDSCSTNYYLACEAVLMLISKSPPSPGRRRSPVLIPACGGL